MGKSQARAEKIAPVLPDGERGARHRATLPVLAADSVDQLPSPVKRAVRGPEGILRVVEIRGFRCGAIQFDILSFQEDRMERHLELRPLTRGERRVLRSKLKDLILSVRVHQRYRVIDQVQRGFSLLEAAERVGCHFTVAYDWVHRFNKSGFGTFEQVPNPKGRPPILRAAQLRELVDVALSSPSERGLPFSVWSVSKLAEYCRRQKLLLR
jgi:transposase